ncbi:MAG: hypothetical protein K0S35_2125 [Geminicoccaceae bacterium]|nr:hypothetical protein [Geminicoccaceae bacterium]
MTARSGVWKRKFSCTISGTPALAQASTIARQSSIAGANGFCTITGTRCAAASSTRLRWLAMVVTTSTKSGRSAASIARASVYRPGTPNASAAAAALDASRSQTAASSTSSMAHQACRWFCAKKPQPITAPLSLSIGHPRSPTTRRPSLAAPAPLASGRVRQGGEMAPQAL